MDGTEGSGPDGPGPDGPGPEEVPKTWPSKPARKDMNRKASKALTLYCTYNVNPKAIKKAAEAEAAAAVIGSRRTSYLYRSNILFENHDDGASWWNVSWNRQQ